eukprot:m.868337 g.868337  ORF g.868337 m.868337 type:complete len:50 (+) comp23562_c0_seq1:109-258(+)
MLTTQSPTSKKQACLSENHEGCACTTNSTLTGTISGFCIKSLYTMPWKM